MIIYYKGVTLAIYKTKPSFIEAFQWTGNVEELSVWLDSVGNPKNVSLRKGALIIKEEDYLDVVPSEGFLVYNTREVYYLPTKCFKQKYELT